MGSAKDDASLPSRRERAWGCSGGGAAGGAQAKGQPAVVGPGRAVCEAPAPSCQVPLSGSWSRPQPAQVQPELCLEARVAPEGLDAPCAH